jgi:hypothetical protein
LIYLLFPVMKNLYEKVTNKVSNFLQDQFGETVKQYAVKKLVKSDYLKETTSIVPLTLISMCCKSVLNFLLFYRIQTKNFIIDSIFSLFLTVTLSLFSPLIGNVFSQLLKVQLDDFSQHLIDNFYNEGWSYYEYWKNRIFLFIGTSTVFLLFFIEVNSFMIQELIIHTMLSSFITDRIFQYTNNMRKLEEKTTIFYDIDPLESYISSDSNKEIIQYKEKIPEKMNISKKNMNKNITKNNRKNLEFSFFEDYTSNSTHF